MRVTGGNEFETEQGWAYGGGWLGAGQVLEVSTHMISKPDITRVLLRSLNMGANTKDLHNHHAP